MKGDEDEARIRKRKTRMSVFVKKNKLRLVHAVTADGMREKTEVEREVREGRQQTEG